MTPACYALASQQLGERHQVGINYLFSLVFFSSRGLLRVTWGLKSPWISKTHSLQAPVGAKPPL